MTGLLRPLRRLLFAVGAAALLLLGPLRAQEAAPPSPPAAEAQAPESEAAAEDSAPSDPVPSGDEGLSADNSLSFPVDI